MKRNEFETLSNKNATTSRSAQLIQIDNALDTYHQARASMPVNAKQVDEDKVKHALESLYTLVTQYRQKYDARHVNTARRQRRKNALLVLRNQIESALYFLPTEFAQRRQDLAYFKKSLLLGASDPVARLTADMKRLKLRVQSCAQTTNTLSAELHAGIQQFFQTEGLRMRDDPNLGTLWQSLVGPDGSGQNPTRCALVDLQALLGAGNQPFVAFDAAALSDAEKAAVWTKMRNPQDPVVGTKLTQNQPAALFPLALRTKLADYLRALCGEELRDQSRLIFDALESEPGFRCVVHFDYYASRDTAQYGLHKDTNGTNLFAVLHYLNADPIVGPEYIDDPAPLEVRTMAGQLVNGFYANYAQIAGRARMGAPWAELAPNKYVWPKPLLSALQAARGNSTTLEHAPLPANGLVSFVDELIFHATPMIAKRPPSGTDDKAVRYLSAGATIPGSLGPFGTSVWGPNDNYLPVFGTRDYARRVQRRMSVNMDELARNNEVFLGGLPIPNAVSGGVRKFWRLWMAIAPSHWYTPLDTATS